MATRAVDVDQALRELLRVARRVADALDARDLGDVFEQHREVGDLAGRAHRAAIGVDVLAEQRDLPHALVGEAGDLGQHVVERARDFLAARVRDDAEAAVLAAAFHDRDERGRPVDARRRQVVELLDLGKADVDLRPPLARRCASSSGRRCSVCGPNTTSTYGARSTIAAPSWLATQPPTPISTPAAFRCLTRPRSLNTFSCAFSRTEQVLNRIRSASLDVVGRLVAVGGMQHVGHLVRVVLVHLAAEGLDEDPRLAAERSVMAWSRPAPPDRSSRSAASSGLVGHGRTAASSGRRIQTFLTRPRCRACS